LLLPDVAEPALPPPLSPPAPGVASLSLSLQPTAAIVSAMALTADPLSINFKKAFITFLRYDVSKVRAVDPIMGAGSSGLLPATC
jgi:hypothetical protein